MLVTCHTRVCLPAAWKSKGMFLAVKRACPASKGAAPHQSASELRWRCLGTRYTAGCKSHVGPTNVPSETSVLLWGCPLCGPLLLLLVDIFGQLVILCGTKVPTRVECRWQPEISSTISCARPPAIVNTGVTTRHTQPMTHIQTLYMTAGIGILRIVPSEGQGLCMVVVCGRSSHIS